MIIISFFCVSVKNLVGGRTYYFKIVAFSLSSYETSEEVKFSVPARVKHKAITAGVVGGILFFIVAIILSVCAVKICNKRKRRKQEKGKLDAYWHCLLLNDASLEKCMPNHGRQCPAICQY